jgi:hypothetical protein
VGIGKGITLTGPILIYYAQALKKGIPIWGRPGFFCAWGKLDYLFEWLNSRNRF